MSKSELKPELLAWFHEIKHESFPETLGIIPLRNAVLLPGGVLSITAGRSKTLALLHALDARTTPVGIVTQKSAETEDPGFDDLHRIGTIGRIIKIQKVNPEAFLIIVHGLARFTLEELVKQEPYWQAKVSPVEEPGKDAAVMKELSGAVKEHFRKLMELLPELPSGVAEMLDDVNDPGLLADLVAANLDFSNNQRLETLVTLNVAERLKNTLKWLTQHKETLEIRQKINAQVRAEFNKHQREAILRQQLKVIQDELGEGEPSNELEELETRLGELELSDDVRKVVKRELDRLKRMNPQQADYHVVRTYLEWVADLPWNTLTEDHIDLTDAERILEEGHYGMKKVKRRVLEYLAIRKLNPDKNGPILCLVGPPGVGKTSLGTAIASAIGRKFVRISLGGVRDEAEIRGHRRTYVGALPGRIIAGLKKAGSRNPVFLMDEIDKLGVSLQGDPGSALLEVLDPEQNHAFSDHYMEVPFDLSKVMFIATANQMDTIPPALRDRMEIIEVPSYAPFEKQVIATQHLLPKQIKEVGLQPDQLIVSEEMMQLVIEAYTREAGVRKLEQQLAAICRAAALSISQNEAESVEVTREMLLEVLGTPRYIPELATRIKRPGVATGLAWTPVGGDLLFIESTRMPGKGHLSLTGQLGDVMKESAQAALAYVRTHATELGVPPNFLEKEDIHIHFPAGGIPKDGPSAGITIFTALTSLLTERTVRSDVAMTGEVTLRGDILPVGGIKEKVLAAHRGGVHKIILPAQNETDLRDLPDATRNALEFVFVKEMGEALSAALEPILAPELPLDLAKPPDPSRSTPQASA